MVSKPEVGVVGDRASPTASSPDVLARIADFESFKRSDVGLNAPGDGDVEWSEGETTEVDRVSLVLETSVSKEVRLLGDFSASVSAKPRFPELSDDDVDGRAASAGCEGVSPVTSVRCGTVLGVRNWILETACLSTVGTFRAGLVASGDELKVREPMELWNEIAVADRGVRGLSTAGLVGASLLMLFCGSERGDGL